MPFTFAHPAIVLPFGKIPKRWISMTGLIIGSMVPDFEYFLRLRVESLYSHTWKGLFWFDLPLGLILVFIYRKYIKDAFIDNLPDFLNRRFSRFKGLHIDITYVKYYIVTLFSVLIGAVTHILWDAFTHPKGYFVRMFSVLSELVSFGGHPIYVYKLLQHLSTFFGLCFIAIFIYMLPTAGKKTSKISRWYWLRLISIAFTVLFIRFATGLSLHRYGDCLVTLIAGGLLGLIITSICVKWERA